jgi:glyoxylase-like metal-dependent hydrolase (beta-lactamase superfamily II)
VTAPSPLPTWCALVRADNPGPMTLDGTNTYVLRRPGAAVAVVVDPGPLDEAHLAAVAEHGPVGLVLLTHGHPDHAEGARRLHEMTGAPVLAADPAHCIGESRLLPGALRFDACGLEISVVATPGHTSDSVSLAVGDDEAGLLTGDTILGRGTTVVAHPDGRLGDYLASLVTIRDLGPLTLLPGHGPPGGDAGERAAAYLVHRAQRLDQVRAALAAGARTPEDVVRIVYADVDPSLWPAAELSVRAQLDHLAASQ